VLELGVILWRHGNSEHNVLRMIIVGHCEKSLEVGASREIKSLQGSHFPRSGETEEGNSTKLFLR